MHQIGIRFYSNQGNFAANLEKLRADILSHCWLFEHTQFQLLIDGRAKTVNSVHMRRDGWLEYDGHRVEPTRVAWVEFWFTQEPVRQRRRFS